MLTSTVRAAAQGHQALCPLCFSQTRLQAVRSAVSRPVRGFTVSVRASDNPARAAITNIVQGIYQVTSALTPVEPGLSPFWTAVKKVDLNGVRAAISSKADLNEVDSNGDTALLYIARQGHYKYKPSEIPTALIEAGANLEAKDKSGLTALEVSLLAGWQNIAELLIKGGAKTGGVPAIKARLTCPDCKRIVAQYKLA